MNFRIGDAMRKVMIPLVLSVFLLGAVFGLVWIARGQGVNRPDGMDVVNSETQGDSVREIYAPPGAAPQQPNIGFIDSPTATCYQPDATQDVCLINWYYLSVSASPNYMITMTAKLNSIGFVANMNGFFQTSMYAPYNMFDRGFKVACGALGAGGNPSLGNAYAYTIRARDSAGLSSANYGTTYCPAYVP
jgi:hypothetical protein